MDTIKAMRSLLLLENGFLMSPEPGCCSLKICDQQLLMLPERALYWREQRVLFVADLHLGKDATFRQAGLPVPPLVLAIVYRVYQSLSSDGNQLNASFSAI